MRTPDWFYPGERPARASALLGSLRLASWCYGAGATIHQQVYARGIRRPRRLECRVISVGSPLVGGTAKTPMAAHVASILQADGHRVALASRGYGVAGRSEVLVVSDGEGLRCTPALAGDEPLVLSAHAPGVPVLIARDRGLAGQRAISEFGTEVLVLDDGFGHHRLARDLEIVTLDGGMGLGSGFVLPRGPLREPLHGLRRADAVGVIDGSLSEADEARVGRLASGSFRFGAVRSARALSPCGGGPSVSPSWLTGKEVGMLCGIAHPASFERTLGHLGARVVARREFPDHHRYRAADLENLVEGPSVWVTTEKDAVKLSADWLGRLDLRVLEIELESEAVFSTWLCEQVSGLSRGSAPGR